MVPDVAVITGDIAQKGDAEDYAVAQQWLDKRLLPALGRGFHPSRLLLVPGNHDVDRGRVKDTAQATQERLLQAASQEKIANILADEDEREDRRLG
jgi:3',5'-cyclic AMP phosphodiesterase CpdA